MEELIFLEEKSSGWDLVLKDACVGVNRARGETAEHKTLVCEGCGGASLAGAQEGE